MSDTAKYAYHYTKRLGFGLVPIPKGRKRPDALEWQNNPITDPEQARTLWKNGMNMGLLHSASNTCVIDVDHTEWFRLAAKALEIDFDLIQLIEAAPVKIQGKNGAKPLYRIPDGLALKLHKLVWPHPTELTEQGQPKNVTVVEFRAGHGKQDVLPPSIHPDTKQPYIWLGTPPRTLEDIPELPPELLALWENMARHINAMKAACPWRKTPLIPEQRGYLPTGTPREGQSVIETFSQTDYALEAELESAGYKRAGQNRYLSPHSGTGAAAVVLYTDEHGIRRARSYHGSDDWNDERGHDAFDLFCRFRHNNNLRAAVRAAAEQLGMARVETPKAELTAEQVQQRWADAQTDLIHKGCEVLDQAQGHPRQKSSLFDLWALLTELACTNVWERGGKFYINPGGLLNLKAQGITGRPADISTRIHYLAGLGFHRGVTKKDPTDKFSQLLIEIPADPLTLPFMALSRQDAESLNVSVPTLNQRTVEPKKVQRKFITTNRSMTYGSYELALCFAAARQTVAWLLACPGATISELAAMRKKHPEVIRRHVRALLKAGLAKREKRGITLTGSWADFRAALRLERESSDTFRRRIVTALKRTIHFCKASVYLKPALPPSQMKRRQHMMKIATTRLSRLEAGEPVYQVMGLAA